MPDTSPTTPLLTAAAAEFGTDRPKRPDALRDSPFPVRHIHTFQSILTTAARNYWEAFDEALRQSPEDARAMRRDGGLIAMLRERQRPVARAKWHIDPEDETDPRQVEAAAVVSTLIRRIPFFGQFRMWLRECDWYGRSACWIAPGTERVRGVDRRGVFRWVPIHGDKLLTRHDGTPGVLIHASELDRCRRNGWLVEPGQRGYGLYFTTRPLRESVVIDRFEVQDADWYEPDLAGGVAGVGLRHHAQWLWWLRAEVVAQMMDFLGQVGTGGLTIGYFEEGNAQSEAKVDQALKDMETGNKIKMPRPRGTSQQTAGIERIDANMAGAQFVTDLVDSFFESKLERLFVGQSGSSTSKTSGMGTHDTGFMQDTKFQLLAGDAEDLSESLTEDLVGPLTRWNYPAGDFKLRFVTDLREPDTKEKLDGIKAFFDLGGEVVEDEVRQVVGLSKPKPGDKTLSQRQATAAGMGGMPGMPGGSGAGVVPPDGAVTGPPGAANGHDDGGSPEGGVPEDAPSLDHTTESTDPADGQSTPDIQAYFQNAVETGQLFTPEGLQRLKAELESGGWRKPSDKLQYAREKAKWSPYRNPATGQSGWKSAAGRVVYEDPTQSPDEHPHGRKAGGDQPDRDGPSADGDHQESPAKPRGDHPGDKVRRHVGVQRGRTGGLGQVTQQLGGMLDDPEAVTPAAMRSLVDSLMTLTVKELNQLRQQYGGKRGRKEEMAAGLTKRLGEEGLPAPAEPKRLDIDATPAVAAATAPKPAALDLSPAGTVRRIAEGKRWLAETAAKRTAADRVRDLHDAMAADARDRATGEALAVPEAYRLPTALEQATTSDVIDPQMAWKDRARHGTAGRAPAAPQAAAPRPAPAPAKPQTAVADAIASLRRQFGDKAILTPAESAARMERVTAALAEAQKNPGRGVPGAAVPPWTPGDARTARPAGPLPPPVNAGPVKPQPQTAVAPVSPPSPVSRTAAVRDKLRYARTHYDPNEPRDRDGQWTAGAGSAGAAVADREKGSASDRKAAAQGGSAVAPPAAVKKARAVALAKFQAAPAPSAADVERNVAGMKELGADRFEANARGNSKDRRASRYRLLAEFGDGQTCPCVYCGLSLVGDPEHGANTVERDKIYTAAQGGKYRHENLVPACRACNLARSDKPFAEFFHASQG